MLAFANGWISLDELVIHPVKLSFFVSHEKKKDPAQLLVRVLPPKPGRTRTQAYVRIALRRAHSCNVSNGLTTQYVRTCQYH